MMAQVVYLVVNVSVVPSNLAVKACASIHLGPPALLSAHLPVCLARAHYYLSSFVGEDFFQS